jgi:hypothetical protein
MLRASIDPKPLIPSETIRNLLGPNDLRIYGEAALLGLENYPRYYEKPGTRVPVMVGFNIPACKVLDVFALEVEWFDTPYPNSFYRVSYYGEPLPVADQFTRQDKFRWSMYAKKKIRGGFAFTAQAARDHMIPTYMKIDNPESYDALPLTAHWWWILKTQFAF